MRLIFITLMTSICLISFGQSIPFGTTWEIDRNVKMEVSVVGYTANGKKVSGTNENFSGAVGFPILTLDDPVYTGDVPWDTTTIVHMKIWIGETLLGTYTPMHNFGLFTKAVRYATTHFSDGTELEIKVEGKFTLSRPGESKNVTVVSPIVKPVVYNKGLSWATHEEVDPLTDQLVYESTPTLPQYCAAAYTGAKQAWEYLKNSMNHQDMFPASKNDTNVQLEPAIAAPLKTKTFVFGFTHGWSTGITASYNDGNTTGGHDDDVLTWANVAGYVVGTSPNLRTAPPINMVIMYACSTCAGGSAVGSDAFGTTINGQTIPDRAYLGYDDTVWSVVDKDNPQGGLYPLSHHSNLLMSKLSAGGWTIAEARDAADLRYKPVVNNNSGNETLTIIKGDDHARMINVYIGTKAGTIAERNSWFIVY